MDQLAPGGVYPVQLGRSEVVLLPDGDVEALVPEAGIFAVPPPIPPHRDVLVIPGMGAKKTCARATAGSMSEGASRRAKRCEGARAAAESTGDGGSRRAKRCAGVDDGRWEHVYRSGRGVFFGFFGVPRSVRAREWRSDAGSRRTVRRGSHPRIQSRWLASRQFGPLVRDPVQSHVNLAQDTGKWSEFVKNGINKTFDTVGFTKLGLSSVFAQVPHPPPLQLSCEFLPPLLESDRQVSFPRDTYLPRNN